MRTARQARPAASPHQGEGKTRLFSLLLFSFFNLNCIYLIEDIKQIC